MGRLREITINTFRDATLHPITYSLDEAPEQFNSSVKYYFHRKINTNDNDNNKILSPSLLGYLRSWCRTSSQETIWEMNGGHGKDGCR